MAIVYLPNEGLVGVLNSRFPAEHVGHIHDSNVTRAGMLQAKRVPELMDQSSTHPYVCFPPSAGNMLRLLLFVHL